MDDPVVPFDLIRMFLGSDPALFYLEIVFRTCIIYGYALLLIRWVGGRGIAQMSVVEFLLVIALGSAVGDGMFYADVPIFYSMLVITLVIVINKGLDILIFRFRPVEKALDGRTAEVIRDGVIDTRILRRRKLGQSELFEGLRENGYRNLGEVRVAYLESSGRFSTFSQSQPRPGLPIEPAWDIEPPVTVGPGTKIGQDRRLACCSCGFVLAGNLAITPYHCPHCQGKSWTAAVIA